MPERAKADPGMSVAPIKDYSFGWSGGVVNVEITFSNDMYADTDRYLVVYDWKGGSTNDKYSMSPAYAQSYGGHWDEEYYGHYGKFYPPQIDGKSYYRLEAKLFDKEEGYYVVTEESNVF